MYVVRALEEHRSNNLGNTATETMTSFQTQFLAGVITLADISPIPNRTIITGNASYLDALVLCPGIHKQQTSDVLPGGVELPATAAMTTGYVFRTENQAMVKFMQRIGVVGAMVTVRVAVNKGKGDEKSGFKSRVQLVKKFCDENDFSLLYLLLPLLTLSAMGTMVYLRDWWAVTVLSMLIVARMMNVIVLRRRASKGWHGILEPGVVGDLLVLLSQDRWVRLRGLVDDLKAVTSGAWLRQATTIEDITTALATTLVYLAGASALGATYLGSLILISLLMSTAGLLSWSNKSSKAMRMHGRTCTVVGKPKHYERRLHLAEEMIAEHGRDDWAISTGMIVPQNSKVEKTTM